MMPPSTSESESDVLVQAIRRIQEAPQDFVTETNDRQAIWRWASRLLERGDLEALIARRFGPLSLDLAANFKRSYRPVAQWPDRWLAETPVLSTADGRIVGVAPFRLCDWADWPHGAVQLACLTPDASKVLLSLRFDRRLELTATGHVDLSDYDRWVCRDLPQGLADVRHCPFEEAAEAAARRELREETGVHVPSSALEWKGSYWWRPSRLARGEIPARSVKPNHELRGVFRCDLEENVATDPPHEPWPQPGFDEDAVRAEFERQVEGRGRHGECLGLYWVDVKTVCEEILGNPIETVRGWDPSESLKHLRRIPGASWAVAASGLLVSFPLVLEQPPPDQTASRG